MKKLIFTLVICFLLVKASLMIDCFLTLKNIGWSNRASYHITLVENGLIQADEEYNAYLED